MFRFPRLGKRQAIPKTELFPRLKKLIYNPSTVLFLAMESCEQSSLNWE
jgi:hypothetical protein